MYSFFLLLCIRIYSSWGGKEIQRERKRTLKGVTLLPSKLPHRSIGILRKSFVISDRGTRRVRERNERFCCFCFCSVPVMRVRNSCMYFAHVRRKKRFTGRSRKGGTVWLKRELRAGRLSFENLSLILSLSVSSGTRWYMARIRDVVRSRSPSWRCFYTGEQVLSYDKSSRNVKPSALFAKCARASIPRSATAERKREVFLSSLARDARVFKLRLLDLFSPLFGSFIYSLRLFLRGKSFTSIDHRNSAFSAFRFLCEVSFRIIR